VRSSPRKSRRLRKARSLRYPSAHPRLQSPAVACPDDTGKPQGHKASPALRRLATNHCCYGSTWNGTLLVSLGPCLVYATKPVVAPVGTMLVIAEPDSLTVNSAAVPLNVTAGRAGQIGPQNLDDRAHLPEVVCVFTSGPEPTDRLKIVPAAPWAPPKNVVPYKFPLVAWTGTE